MTLTNFGIWEILSIISAIGIIIFWRSKNAVWGGLTIGAVIGVIVALIYLFMGDGFIWKIVGKGIVIGTIFGIISQVLGSISDRLKKNPK
jgi:hypothetical protein